MPGSMRTAPSTTDRHALYEAAVQCVDADLDFVERVYRRRNGTRPVTLREDFCGTAALAAAWAARRSENRAVGVDLHAATLAWGRRHRLRPIGDAASRVRLVRADVRRAERHPADVAVALNFSFCVFRRRGELAEYFGAVRRSLRPGGLFVLDMFGGQDGTSVLVESKRKGGTVDPDGRRVAPFTYLWEQVSFNPVDRRIRCAIHFRLRGGRIQRNAFTYDWRAWTLPELTEVLLEAGFAEADVYAQGWDEADQDGDGKFRKTDRFEDQSSWVVYVVAARDRVSRAATRR